MRRLAPLGAAAAVYVIAAWLVPPGFFDGFAPPAPYHWVSPPPELKASNQAPTSGQATIAVRNGSTEAGHVFTIDQQASVTFPSQSFEAPPNAASVTLEIKPVPSYPDFGGIVPAGNVYLVSVSTRLISPVVVTLRYGSQKQDPPSQIFAAANSSAGWKSIGSINNAVPYTVAASTQTLGYFVAGYPPAPSATAAPTASAAGSPPVLALVALAAAVLVVVAGIPVVATRRRAVRPASDEAEPPPSVPQNLGGAKRRGRRRGRR